MKILIVTTFGFDPAFPSRPEQLQARALVRHGYQVVAHEYFDRRYAGQSIRHEWLPGDIPVHRAQPFGFFAPEALLRLLVAERPDIIHLQHMRNLLSYQTVLAARRLGIPTVLTVNGLLHDADLVVDRERPLEAPLRYDNLLTTPGRLVRRLARGAHPRRAFRNYLIHAPLLLVDRIISLAHGERELLARIGIKPEIISVLPPSVDMYGYDPRIINQPDPARPIVLFIGQLVPRKGFDILARAMPAVVQAVPGVRFVFVSFNRAGEAELRQIVADGGVEANFELVGQVSEPEKLRLLREAAVVAAPSRYEGFGIPLIEALLAGTPVVTTDVIACNEVITHEQTGLLVPYADHAALAAAIVRLLMNPALARSFVEAGRREVLVRYSADSLVAGLENVYQTLV
ncbi:MAG: glycosyltransferase family 4 protein [Oscillochloris sp.]|nr:glycosyltransferase family 4 protein [Oscillochloris sp.]